MGLTGCESANKTLAFLHFSQSETAAGNASSAPPRGPETTGSIAVDAQVAAAEPLAPGDPNDDLNLGKRHYRANNFGLAERYFRRAQGYSYLLRGDYRHAREKLVAARDLDPGNPYIQNNLDLLAKSARPR